MTDCIFICWSLQGIVDRFDSSVDIHNSCCLLWGHHPSVLQILICSHGYTFLQGDPLLGFGNYTSIIIGASCLCYSGHLLHGSQILKPQNVRIGLLIMEDIPVCCIWMLLQFCYNSHYMLSAFHVKVGIFCIAVIVYCYCSIVTETLFG